MKGASIMLASAGLLVQGIWAVPKVRANADLVNKRTAICGARGYDNGRDSYWDSTDGDYDACSLECAQEIQCQSFAYGSGACYLFDVEVVDNFEVDSQSPYAFYDVSCPEPKTPSTSSDDQAVLGGASTRGADDSASKPRKSAKKSKKRFAKKSK